MKKFTDLLLLTGLIFGIWFWLKTEYKFTKYKMAGCDRYLTLVEYSSIFSRGAVLVAGEYSIKSVPASNCFVLPAMNGFDSYFECIATCKGNNIIITYDDYVPQQPVNSGIIISRKLDNVAYLSIRRNEAENIIKVF